MEKITIDLCMGSLLDSNKKTIIWTILFAILSCITGICGWLRYNDIFALVANAILIILVLFFVILLKIRNDKLKAKVFYIVEDVLLNVQKHYVSTWFGRAYTIRFSGNGVYNAYSYTERGVSKTSCDRSVIYDSTPGDKFYLLLTPGKRKEVILKCFDAKFFEISDDEFDYLDGKYYPKEMEKEHDKL